MGKRPICLDTGGNELTGLIDYRPLEGLSCPPIRRRFVSFVGSVRNEYWNSLQHVSFTSCPSFLGYSRG